MHKYWVVLKVSLTRPWVWLMLFFGLFQVMPLALFLKAAKLSEIKVAILAFDEPEVVVSQTQELQELAKQNRLGTIEGLNARDLHGEVLFEQNGQPRASAEMLAQPRQADQMGGWPFLEQVPQLKSLEMHPPNGLNAAGWRRIGQLSNLESLTLENIGAVDGEALKTGGADLQTALSHLTNLRQLNVNNTGGTFNWKLPEREIPHWREIVICVTVYSIYIVVYRFILYRLPIFYQWRTEEELAPAYATEIELMAPVFVPATATETEPSVLGLAPAYATEAESMAISNTDAVTA